MKKFKIPKIKIEKTSIKGFFNYLLVILLTSFILVSILISLPLTETISSNITYDLKTKDEMYWAKDYILELQSTDSAQIGKVKSILYRRLSKLGVEKIHMDSFSQDDKEYIRVHVQSSQPQVYADELVRSPFIISIVTRNPEVDFEDPDNPYSMYLAENYIPTEFSREDFRNIYVTSLKNSANEYSYFALFKTWFWENKWDEYLDENKGAEIGVAIDGFVTPVTVPSASPFIFAAPLSAIEKEESKLVSILYNSGNMPVSYTLADQEEVPVENIEADYIKITMGVMIAVTAIYAYLLFVEKTNKKTLVTCALTTVITVSLWIAYLKIASIPVDISILAIEILVMIALLRMTVENSESKIVVNVLLVLAASLTAILGSGYAKIFASDLFLLLILGYMSELIAKVYIHKVDRLLK